MTVFVPSPRSGLLAAILTVVLAGCSYAPLPSGGAGGADAQTAQSVSQDGADATGTVLPNIDGQVCCVAADTTGPTVVEGISITYNGWDTAFISWMVPHYAVASQLAELAPTRSGNAEVKALALKVDGALSPNYLKMAAMARAWGQPVPSTDPSAASGHDHGGDDSSGLDNAAQLTKLTGKAFDKKYLDVLIADDKAALQIADATIANCTNPQAKVLAQQIAADVTAEIGQAQQMLKEAV